MNIEIGEVVSVKGLKIILRVFDASNKDVLFFEGNKYNGISIREHIIIRRGFINIVCIVEGEYLDESKFEVDNTNLKYVRKVEVKPIGYFKNESFYEGIKYLPMILDVAFLVTDETVAKLYGRDGLNGFVIGKMLKEGFPISLPWAKLFNSHIGIFGNTGSGKSNTLAKLYTTLFEQKRMQIRGKSNFVLIDFNGEYIGDQLIDADDKQIIQLNTGNDDGDKFPLTGEDFWDKETLSILFKATANTQAPFLNRIVNGKNRFADNNDSINNYLKSIVKQVFVSTNPKRECLELLLEISKIMNNADLTNKLKQVNWHSQSNVYYHIDILGNSMYFNQGELTYNNFLRDIVEEIALNPLNAFNELIIRSNLQLIRDLMSGYVQFEFIQPLLKRMEASIGKLRRVIEINDNELNLKILTIISLRKCNQDIKKIVPLLLAKHYYNYQKSRVNNPIDKTMNLIIDEAHNVLSLQSTREEESWKDYRLELFEEIIKEGRKFGMFLTLASQRPADISPTIMSQIHNFFIHRLVNDRDLFLLENTISTLDFLSKQMIPNLGKGCCVVTGSSFDLPVVIKVARLNRDQQPDSDDVNLNSLWNQEEI